MQRRSLNGLTELLRKLCKKYEAFNLKLIILYGSYARGDYTNESDIDLLIIADKIPSDPRSI